MLTILLIFIIFLILFFSDPQNPKMAWLWNNVGSKVLNFKTGLISDNRVAISYFGLIALINGSGTFLNLANASFDFSDSTLWLSFGKVDWIVIISEIIVTLPYVMHIHSKNKKFDPKQLIEIIQQDTYKVSLTQKDYNNILTYIDTSIFNLKFIDIEGVLIKIIENLNSKNRILFAIRYKVYFLLYKCKTLESNYEEQVKYIDLAYSDMKYAETFDVEVVTSYIQINLQKLSPQDLNSLYDELKERSPQNVILYVIDIYNKNTSIAQIPKTIAANLNFILLLNKFGLVNEYKTTVNAVNLEACIPSNLNFNNFFVWVFLTSISHNFMLCSNLFDCPHKIKDKTVIKLNQFFNKFSNLLKETDLKNFFLEIEICKLYTSYLFCEQDRNDVILKSFIDIEVSNKMSMIRDLMYYQMLIINQNYNKAKEVLFSHVEICNIIVRLKLVFAILYGDKEIAIEQIRQTKNIGLELDSLLMDVILSAVRIFNLEEEIDEKFLSLDIPCDEGCYRECLSFYKNNQCNLEILKGGITIQNPKLRLEVLLILDKILSVQEVIEIFPTPPIEDGYTSLMYNYLNILKKASELNVKRYWILKQLKSSLNVDEIPVQCLQDEFQLAMQCSDIDNAEVCISALYKLCPENNSVYVELFSFYANTQNKAEAFKLFPYLDKYAFNANQRICIYNSLLTLEYFEKAIQFLYDSIINVGGIELKEEYFKIAANPILSKFIDYEKDVIEEADYVELIENGQIQECMVEKESAYESLLGHRVGDIVTLPSIGLARNVRVSNILNKYNGLSRSIYKELSESKSSKKFCSVTLDELKAIDDDILMAIRKVSNADVREKEERVWQEEYNAGKQFLLSRFASHAGIAEMYDYIYGESIIHSIPFCNYPQNLSSEIKDCSLVLELSSLILLVEISNTFGIIFDNRKIVSKGTYDYIKKQKQLLKINLPYYFNTTTKTNLNITDNLQFLNKLDDLIEWIEQNCEIMICEDILQLDCSKSHNDLFVLLFESYLLSKKNNGVFVTEDWGLQTHMPGHRIINLESLSLFLNEEKGKTVSDWLASLNFVEVTFSEDYFLNQFRNFRIGNPNKFNLALQNIRRNNGLIFLALKLTAQIYFNEILIESDKFTLYNIFFSIFVDRDIYYCKKIMKTVLSRTDDRDYLKIMAGAFMAAHPFELFQAGIIDSINGEHNKE